MKSTILHHTFSAVSQKREKRGPFTYFSFLAATVQESEARCKPTVAFCNLTEECQ